MPNDFPMIFFDVERQEKAKHWTEERPARSRHSGIIVKGKDGNLHAWGIGPVSGGYFNAISENTWSPFEHRMPETDPHFEFVYTSFYMFPEVFKSTESNFKFIIAQHNTKRD